MGDDVDFAARRHYWKRVFPARMLETMLTLHEQELGRREFALSCVARDGTEYMERYVCVGVTPVRWDDGTSFEGPTQLQLRMKRHDDTRALHVGGVGATLSSDKTKFVANRSEFCVDIDVTDVPWLHLDKGDQAGCDDAWPRVMRDLEQIGMILHESFGFEHMVSFYSGRRGAHIWVLDRRAFDMSGEVRDSVARYLEHSTWKERIDESIHRVLKHTEYADGASLMDRHMEWMGDALQTPNDIREFLRRLDIQKLSDITNYVASMTGKDALKAIKKAVHELKLDWAPARLEAVVAAYVYPLIDVKVSSQTAHLMKAPFSAHAATGRICLFLGGFDAAAGRFAFRGGFDPRTCPTATQLLKGQNREAFDESLRDLQTYLTTVQGCLASDASPAKIQRTAPALRASEDIEDLAREVDRFGRDDRGMTDHGRRFPGPCFVVVLDREIGVHSTPSGMDVFFRWRRLPGYRPFLVNTYTYLEPKAESIVPILTRAFKELRDEPPGRELNLHTMPNMVLLRARDSRVSDGDAAAEWLERVARDFEWVHVLHLDFADTDVNVRARLERLRRTRAREVTVVGS